MFRRKTMIITISYKDTSMAKLKVRSMYPLFVHGFKRDTLRRLVDASEWAEDWCRQKMSDRKADGLNKLSRPKLVCILGLAGRLVMQWQHTSIWKVHYETLGCRRFLHRHPFWLAVEISSLRICLRECAIEVQIKSIQSLPNTWNNTALREYPWRRLRLHGSPIFRDTGLIRTLTDRKVCCESKHEKIMIVLLERCSYHHYTEA